MNINGFFFFVICTDHCLDYINTLYFNFMSKLISKYDLPISIYNKL